MIHVAQLLTPDGTKYIIVKDRVPSNLLIDDTIIGFRFFDIVNDTMTPLYLSFAEKLKPSRWIFIGQFYTKDIIHNIITSGGGSKYINSFVGVLRDKKTKGFVRTNYGWFPILKCDSYVENKSFLSKKEI